MDLLHLVDRLEELVAGAQKMPIGNRAIVDRRRMLDLIDQMRIAVPREVREAQDIVAQRDAIRREAEEEGRIIVAQAEQRAGDLIEEHAITDGAKRRAEEIALEAERRLEEQIEAANRDMQARIQESRRAAREQMAAADEYARELLVRLERQLQAFQNSVRAGIEQVEPTSTAPAYHQPAPLAPQAYEADLARSAGPTSGVSRAQPADSPEPFESRRPVDYAAPSDDDELEDLLARQRPLNLRGDEGRFGQARQQAANVEGLDDLGELEDADPGVIDDFENQPLDDDPMLRPAPRDRDFPREFDDRD